MFRISTPETDASLKGTLTVPVSNFNGAIVGSADNARAVRDAAHRAAELVLQRVILDEQDPMPIGATSKQSPFESVSLDIDFTPFFRDRRPTAEEWNSDFPRALKRVKSALIARSVTRIRLRCFAHLSLGTLFGFVFSERTGFGLEIEQTNRGRDKTI